MWTRNIGGVLPWIAGSNSPFTRLFECLIARLELDGRHPADLFVKLHLPNMFIRWWPLNNRKTRMAYGTSTSVFLVHVRNLFIRKNTAAEKET